MRKEREDILRRCDEEGITIIELAEILEKEAEENSDNLEKNASETGEKQLDESE